MKEIFSQEDTDGVILVDTSYAFNRLNRKVAMHNLRITCPALATYVINIYRHKAIKPVYWFPEDSAQYIELEHI